MPGPDEKLTHQFEPEVSDSVLTRTGLRLSWGYLAILVIYTLMFTDWAFDKPLAPNELGDFLAGAFAPLAFLWLVLGFLQQGRELRNSAKALHLQVDELKASVEQSRLMVEVARDQLNLDHEKMVRSESQRKNESQPIFRMQSGGSSHSGNRNEFRFHLLNAGHECFELEGRLAMDGIDEMIPFGTQAHFPTGSKVKWQFSLLNGHPFHDGTLFVTFRDINRERKGLRFPIKVSSSAGRLSVNVDSQPQSGTDL